MTSVVTVWLAIELTIELTMLIVVASVLTIEWIVEFTGLLTFAFRIALPITSGDCGNVLAVGLCVNPPVADCGDHFCGFLCGHLC